VCGCTYMTFNNNNMHESLCRARSISISHLLLLSLFMFSKRLENMMQPKKMLFNVSRMGETCIHTNSYFYHVNVQKYVHTFIYMYIYVYMYVHIYVYVYIYVYSYMYNTLTNICIHTQTIFVCMYICIHACLPTYIHPSLNIRTFVPEHTNISVAVCRTWKKVAYSDVVWKKLACDLWATKQYVPPKIREMLGKVDCARRAYYEALHDSVRTRITNEVYAC